MSNRKSIAGRKRKKLKDAVSSSKDVFFDEELDPVEVQMVPTDQLTLNDPELDEEFTKTLTSLDPNKAAKITHFNFRNGAFESRPNDKHMAFHVATEGVIWSAKERAERERLRRERADKERSKRETEDGTKSGTANKTGAQTPAADGAEADPDADGDGGDGDGDGDGDDGKEPEAESEELDEVEEQKLVKNQFNFSDRASQTFNEPQRDRMVQTEPAPKSVFSQNASASAIRDEYLKNLLKAKQQAVAEEESKRRKSGFGGGNQGEDAAAKGSVETEHRIKHHDAGDALLHSAEMLRALKIMERVAVLNANAPSYHDFAFWRRGDAKRGSFVQRLWTFRFDGDGTTGLGGASSPKKDLDKGHDAGKSELGLSSMAMGSAAAGKELSMSAAKGSTVTALEWNRQHLDLFAVGYGSYSFHEQSAGRICLFRFTPSAHLISRCFCFMPR